MQISYRLIWTYKNICLVSKISKEDSLVLISAVSPIRNNYNENCILLTNDADFNSWYEQAKDKIDNVFTEKSMPKPHLKHIKSAQLFDKQFNFTDNKLDITGFEVYANKCILSLLKIGSKIFISENHLLLMGLVLHRHSPLKQKKEFIYKIKNM